MVFYLVFGRAASLMRRTYQLCTGMPLGSDGETLRGVLLSAPTKGELPWGQKKDCRGLHRGVLAPSSSWSSSNMLCDPELFLDVFKDFKGLWSMAMVRRSRDLTG